ncbi:autotransporter outer membrane beta-barrel domain-containing protein [Endozoicomonas euniceicola]|uniref:Autotransporter outer membrane beta-barrel domain-containing protein n=1 Tax=Endozoicomonas euniceicola TaxID=1234143 RepID=A0ABY6GZ93_9GAMM|nr:autotransporter outer membrane beta-barrel domain-containing protein [Endozoicomonas euniceicola]UYM17366.1 autotransporter outer membrane beta-barrel domain-containing protein [Endozoicomonas euniceicola]
MKPRALFSLPVKLAVLGGLSGFIQPALLADEPQVNFDQQNKTAHFKYTDTRTDVLDIKVDTSKVWKAPEQDVYYFKVMDVNGDIAGGRFLPIEQIPPSQLVSAQKVSAVLSQPAIADRMMHEASLHAYDSFTRLTSSILSGRIPAAALSESRNAGLYDKPSSHWLAQKEPDDAVDYLGQEDLGQSDVAADHDTFYNYSQVVKQGAKAFVYGEWFGLMQVYGHFLDQKKVNDMAGFKSNGYGIQMSLLRPVGNEWLIGIYGAWQKLTADLKDFNGGVESGTWRVGPTIAWRRGSLRAEGLVTYNWNTIDSKSHSYKADYKSRQWDVYARGGYDLDLSHLSAGLTLTPEVQLMYVNRQRDDFNWFTQMVKKGKSGGWVSRLGAVFTYEREQFSQPFELKLSLGWQHSDLKTADLEVEGKKKKYGYYDQNGAYYSVGLDTFLYERLNMSLVYGGVWMKESLSHHILAGLEVRF